MPDVMKFIVDEAANQTDPAGHMMGLEEWNRAIAEKRAAEDGLSLGPRHWDVICFLRDHYREHGPVRHARDIVKALDERFASDGGRKFLYQLFPKGPVRQASRIAGLPVPADAVDPGFGSAQ